MASSALAVTLDFRTISRAAAGLAGATIQTATLVRAGTQIILTSLKAEAPVGKDQTDWSGALTHKGGQLRDSIVARSSGPQGAGFYGVYYGEYVVHGTRPHLIMPRVKKALHWGGKPGVTARSVQHPGTKPNDFVLRGVLAAEPALRVVMLENGRTMLRLIATRTGAA